MLRVYRVAYDGGSKLFFCREQAKAFAYGLHSGGKEPSMSVRRYKRHPVSRAMRQAKAQSRSA